MNIFISILLLICDLNELINIKSTIININIIYIIIDKTIEQVISF